MDERMIYAFGGVVAGAVAGAGATYLLLMKKFEKDLQEALEVELEATKKFYSAIHKAAYPTPEDAVSALVGAPIEIFSDEDLKTEYLEKTADYETDQPEPEKGDEMTEITKNVFTNYANVSTWDADKEEAERDPSKPYVISFDEFFENEPDYIQTQLVYFSEDGVLADTTDKPVDEAIVGEENLQKFGHGSKDPNIVYIRNEAMDLDFEIMYAEGKYSEQVMGFMQHSASPGRALRKFRLDED